MTIVTKRWQVTTLLVLLCAGVIGVVEWRFASRAFDSSALVECLPPDQAVHVYIDTAALRQGGILDLLAGSKAAEDSDYKQFVDQTGFDYRSDLDAVAAAFVHGDTYFVARGRFNWRKLTAYADSSGGFCRNSVCQMPASTRGRHISFYPIRNNILALAVAADDRAVSMIGPSQWRNPPQLPPEPVWISAPSFVFSDVKNLPEGTHAFLSPLAEAQKTTFAIGPDGNHLRIRAEILCNSPEAAAALAQQLTASTDLLRKMLEREHMTPNPRDLSAVLIGGKFAAQNNRVSGTWEMDRGLLESLATQ